MATNPVAAYLYPFDSTGTATTNKVTERQTLSPPSAPGDFHFILPAAAPFYATGLVVTHLTSGKVLTRGVDYLLGHKFVKASFTIGKDIFGSILFTDLTLSGQVSIVYQTVGDKWVLSATKILEILTNKAIDPRTTTWDSIEDMPDTFPVVAHSFNIDDFVGMSELVTATSDIATAIRERTAAMDKNFASLIPSLDTYMTKDQVMAELAKKLNATDQAMDSKRIEGMTADELLADVAAGTSTEGIQRRLTAVEAEVDDLQSGAGSYVTPAQLSTALEKKLDTDATAANALRVYSKDESTLLGGYATTDVTASLDNRVSTLETENAKNQEQILSVIDNLDDSVTDTTTNLAGS